MALSRAKKVTGDGHKDVENIEILVQKCAYDTNRNVVGDYEEDGSKT